MIAKTTTKRRVLLLWSGGLDSTALMLRYLQAGWAVDALPVVFKNSYAKNEREQTARDGMFKEYFSKYDVTVLSSPEVSFPEIGNIPFTQLTVWVNAAIMSLRIGHHDEVAISYVMNDDAISFLADIQALWKAHKPFFAYAGVLPPLKFPLSKARKQDLYSEMPPTIFQHVTWCESAFGADFCGLCGPCRRAIALGHQHALIAAIEANPELSKSRIDKQGDEHTDTTGCIDESLTESNEQPRIDVDERLPAHAST